MAECPHKSAHPGVFEVNPWRALDISRSSGWAQAIRAQSPSSNMAATALALQPVGTAAVQPCRRSATARPFQPRAARRAHLHVACRAAQEPDVLAVTRRTAAAAFAALPALLFSPAGTAAARTLP